MRNLKIRSSNISALSSALKRMKFINFILAFHSFRTRKRLTSLSMIWLKHCTMVNYTSRNFLTSRDYSRSSLRRLQANYFSRSMLLAYRLFVWWAARPFFTLYLIGLIKTEMGRSIGEISPEPLNIPILGQIAKLSCATSWPNWIGIWSKATTTFNLRSSDNWRTSSFFWFGPPMNYN